MIRSLTSLLLVTLLFTSEVLRADKGAAATQTRGFRPIWTAVGASAGFGLGVWAGLAKFDDALYSDRKVWTTAIVSAAAGGAIGFLIDRRQARNPSARPLPAWDRPVSWREDVYGFAAVSPSLRLPTVARMIGVESPSGRGGAPSQ
jgi:hypothetical protein